MVLKLVHARRREEYGGVPAGDEYIARFSDTAFGLKKRQVFFSQFVRLHVIGSLCLLGVVCIEFFGPKRKNRTGPNSLTGTIVLFMGTKTRYTAIV